MNQEISKYLEKYPSEIKDQFMKIRKIVMESTDLRVEERIWAKLPSYYVGENFVRVIPFKDHINIEAAGVNKVIELFTNYKITPKGMLQISLKQDVPVDELSKVIKATF